MTTADAEMPATSGIGIILPQVGKHHQAMKQKEDPHVAKVFEELEAPQQPGEPNQAYEQRCAAAIRLCNMPMPAFFGYAGVNSQQKDAPDAEYLKKKVNMEIPTDILLTNEAEHIGLADNL